MGIDPRISGAKGGGSAHTPVEAPDTLRSISYFRIEDLLSEGEIGGLVNGLQSVKLNGTPVANADGSLNFTGVSVQIRTGTQDQSYIPGYGAVESEIAVSTELKFGTPWVRALSNVELSAFKVLLQVDALQKSDTSNGDINGYSIQYAIDVSTDGGAYNTVLTTGFTGKASGPYQRSHRIDLPRATTGWNVRVRRLTVNANSSTTADTTRVMSMTEIIDAKLRYPNSAYVAISGDASQFSSIPARSYVCWGRLIRIPSNYDPKTRTYTGVWDGSFKIAWTNNPAWILYDMVVQERFGLGDLIDASLIDKWELYRIGQYCDQMVSDGKGGQEPRFTCTTYLQNRADAFRLLGDMASVFRGVSYWMGGAITSVADMPQDPVYTYTAANVIDGRFTYQSSARKTRYSTALVTWNDPANSYRQVAEYVDHPDALRRYGIQPTEFVAFGCTSQGQAHRAGQWALTTSYYETDSVTFAVGLEGLKAAPGQIVRVVDPARAGARQGGRISMATATAITVDRSPDGVAVGDTLTVNLPTGTAETRMISAIDGRVIRVGQAFSQLPAGQAVWAVESATLAAQTFRILNVSEDTSDGAIRFTISAVQHVAGKFAFIDNGTQIQIPPISKLPVGSQVPPTNVRITSHQVVEQGIANNVMTIAWDAPAGAARYQVEWQKDSGQWIQAGNVSTTSVDVIGIYTGTYVARVTAYNNGNTPSLAALSDPTPVLGKTGAPPALTSLTAKSLVFGIRLDWGFPAGAEDSQRTEIWYGTTANRDNATKLGDYAYPGNFMEMHGLAAGTSLFFWGRIIDKAGNVGPWYPEVGAVNGQSSIDAAAYDQYFSGKINESALGHQLLSDIEAVKDVGGQLADMAEKLGAVEGEISRVDGIISVFDPPMAGDEGEHAGDTTVYAGVYSEQSARADADGALAKRIDTVAASMDGFSALVRDETTARVTADGAMAERITTVQAATDTATAAVQQVSQAVVGIDGKIRATYTVRAQVMADGRIYGAGMGLGVEQQPDGSYQSQVLFQADRFAVVNVANGVTTAPFVIQGGQVFINQAIIGTGYITNAMIGNVIQSTAVDSTGNALWTLDKNTGFSMRGSGGAGRTEHDGNGGRVYDTNGVLRVRWGIW